MKPLNEMIYSGVASIVCVCSCAKMGGGSRVNELMEFGMACQGYYEEYGTFELQETRLLVKMLQGGNPRQIAFLREDYPGIDMQGNLLDPFSSRPIRVYFSNETILFWSAGNDGRYSQNPGDGDDRVWYYDWRDGRED